MTTDTQSLHQTLIRRKYDKICLVVTQ